MNILGHYLDMTTGKELPVVTARVANVNDVYADLVVDGQVSNVLFDERELPLKSSTSRPVTLEFVENPAYMKARRQMIGNEFDGPHALPVVVMVGTKAKYPCEMIPVSELRSTWK